MSSPGEEIPERFAYTLAKIARKKRLSELNLPVSLSCAEKPAALCRQPIGKGLMPKYRFGWLMTRADVLTEEDELEVPPSLRKKSLHVLFDAGHLSKIWEARLPGHRFAIPFLEFFGFTKDGVVVFILHVADNMNKDRLEQAYRTELIAATKTMLQVQNEPRWYCG